MNLRLRSALILLTGLFLVMHAQGQVTVSAPVVAPVAATATVVPDSGGIFEFEEMSHDFGEVAQHSDIRWGFKFTNVGTSPIKISHVKGSGGGAVASWPHEPIPVGASEVIMMQYHSGSPRDFCTRMVVYSNTHQPELRLEIKGKILPMEKPVPTVPSAPTEGH